MVCSFHIAVILDYLFQYLSPIGRLYLAEKEVHEIPPCVLVQFVVQSSESFKLPLMYVSTIYTKMLSTS